VGPTLVAAGLTAPRASPRDQNRRKSRILRRGIWEGATASGAEIHRPLKSFGLREQVCELPLPKEL